MLKIKLHTSRGWVGGGGSGGGRGWWADLEGRKERKGKLIQLTLWIKVRMGA